MSEFRHLASYEDYILDKYSTPGLRRNIVGDMVQLRSVGATDEVATSAGESEDELQDGAEQDREAGGHPEEERGGDTREGVA
jgi:hypothetical protein